ncbi:MAG: hypothetical protein WA635_07750, partial [Gallionella sp.]
MNRVADKNRILAATRYCAAADCGSGEVASYPHWRYAYREPMPTARRATPVVVILRCQGAQHRERPFLLQPAREFALRAICCVRLLAKGIT